MSTTKPDLKPDDWIDKYKLLRVLGAGGMAAVYLAQQKWTKRKVALKLYTSKANDTWVKAAHREAEILASMDHPHIMDLYDVGEYNGYFYQVVEYVDGKSLQDMLEPEDPTPISVVLKLMIDIADALDYLHRLGIVHGDVKPGNIMVSSGGIPILVDFGISETAQENAFQDLAVGTPPYISPEGWRSIRDKRSDLWAFGMMLHHMLAGRLPFDTTNSAEIKRIVTSQMPLDFSSLRKSAPQPVTRIVERCLQRDPDQRYQSAVDLRRDLESALAYLELVQPETATHTPVPLFTGTKILLNVEYKETGIPGQYREYGIGEKLGQGSFSIVYRARDAMGNRQVALKILRQEQASDERDIGSLPTRGELACSLKSSEHRSRTQLWALCGRVFYRDGSAGGPNDQRYP